MSRIEELEEQIRLEESALAKLAADIPFSDGQNYSHLRLKYGQRSQELNALYQELQDLTVHTVVYPSWVRNERAREAVEIARKARVQSVLDKLQKHPIN